MFSYYMKDSYFKKPLRAIPVLFLLCSITFGQVGVASAASTAGTTEVTASLIAQIQSLLQIIAKLQAQLGTSSASDKTQGEAPEHAYKVKSTFIDGNPSIQLTAPIKEVFDMSNPLMDVIQFRWAADNISQEGSRVEILYKRTTSFEYSGPLSGGTWEGELPVGDSTGEWKLDISQVGSLDAGEYKVKATILNKNGKRVTSSKWVKFTVKDSKAVANTKTCTIKTDKKSYSVGEKITVSWNSKNFTKPYLQDNNKAGGAFEVRNSGSWDFITYGEYEHSFSLQDDYSGYSYDFNPSCTVKVKVVNNASNKLQNLSIASVNLSLPGGIGHTSIPGSPVPDQTVKVIVKNNEFGDSQSYLKTFKYIATLYEADSSGKLVKTGAVTTGEAVVPAGAYGSSEFEFNLDGGFPFDGKNFEKKYQIKVEIDANNDVKESNENDNSEWSKTWITSYYKG